MPWHTLWPIRWKNQPKTKIIYPKNHWNIILFFSFKQLENFYFIYVPAINWLQYFPPKQNIFTTRRLKIKHEKENQNSWLDPMNCTIDKKLTSIIFWQNFVKIGHSALLCAFWNRNSRKKLMRLYKKGQAYN